MTHFGNNDIDNILIELSREQTNQALHVMMEWQKMYEMEKKKVTNCENFIALITQQLTQARDERDRLAMDVERLENLVNDLSA